MTPILIASFGQFLMQLLLGGVALFLILLILVQRGRGGGLAGALGGAGGSSAFGAKAGDVFTRITAIAAGVWMVLCIASAWVAPGSESRFGEASASSAPPAVSAAGDAEDQAEAGADEEAAPEQGGPAEDAAGEEAED